MFMQCLWRCYAADPRSQFSATWCVHVRQHAASHQAAGHNIVRSFSRVARRASISLGRLARASTLKTVTSGGGGSPDAPSCSSNAATVSAAAAGHVDRRHAELADDVSGLLLTAAERPGLFYHFEIHIIVIVISAFIYLSGV